MYYFFSLRQRNGVRSSPAGFGPHWTGPRWGHLFAWRSTSSHGGQPSRLLISTIETAWPMRTAKSIHMWVTWNARWRRNTEILIHRNFVIEPIETWLSILLTGCAFGGVQLSTKVRKVCFVLLIIFHDLVIISAVSSEFYFRAFTRWPHLHFWACFKSLSLISILPLNHLFRTKSQKKRFEEELNERIIRTIHGINSQKWVPIIPSILSVSRNWWIPWKTAWVRATFSLTRMNSGSLRFYYSRI